MYNIGGTMRLRRRRKFVNHKKRIMYFSLFFLVLFISVGYAYLSRALSINGHTELRANTWNIHFENLSIKEGSVEAVTPAAIDGNTTTINYSIKLARPGNFYEFEVDVVNGGTVGAKLSLVSVDGISSELEPLLKSSINYVSGNPVQVNDLLSPSSRKRIVVRVEYSKDDLNNLPEENTSLDLEFNITYTQTSDKETTTGTIIQQLKTENSSCFTEYNGQVTDQVGETVTASNVYFNKCADKRNIIFGGFCWQMIRTTETGGLKMVYNGEPVNDKCEANRGDHIGVVQNGSGSVQNISSNYLYGSSFDYDINTNQFTLKDTRLATWSDSTYDDLVGKFTCLSTSGTCTTMYNINSYENSTSADLTAYSIGNTHYSQIGTGALNANYRGPANVGYMFNKVYNYNSKESSEITGNIRFGSSFSYNSSTNTYTLTGTTTISNWSQQFYLVNNARYTCWNNNGRCRTISFVSYYDNEVAYFFDITGGKSSTDILQEMLSNNDVNRYNSTAKAFVDNWYLHNLNNKTYALEDIVHCNNRDIISYGAWDPNGNNNSGSYYIQFKNFVQSTDLSCQQATDQFAISNNIAKLTYPVGLIQSEEVNNINNNSLISTGTEWWAMSPIGYGYSGTYVRYVDVDGALGNDGVNNMPLGYRPVISILSSNIIISGSGSESDPWIIE